MALITVVHGHPYPERSRAGARLLAAIHDLPDLEVRSLYHLYPDFDIDVAREQRALADTRCMVWLHPLYWYTAPALLKLWFDRVLVKGFAYGPGGTALAGTSCLWVPTTGGDEHAYSGEGRHGRPFEHFSYGIEQTARYCGMEWLPPHVVHGAHLVSDDALSRNAAELRARLEAFKP